MAAAKEPFPRGLAGFEDEAAYVQLIDHHFVPWKRTVAGRGGIGIGRGDHAVETAIAVNHGASVRIVPPQRLLGCIDDVELVLVADPGARHINRPVAIVLGKSRLAVVDQALKSPATETQVANGAQTRSVTPAS
jgi:hypothetical protein